MANIQDQAAPLPPKPVVVTDIAERVALMEDARHKGEHVIRLISESLKSSRINDDPEVKNWQQSFGNLIKMIKNLEILIGVMGETGLGKSSLINQVLGIDICPTNQAEACTAAVCVFAWNESNMPESMFRATITYKSAASVSQELEAFLDENEEIERMLKDETDGADPDLKRRAADLRKTLGVVQAWSGLSAGAIKSAQSADDIIRQSNHKALRQVSQGGELCNKSFVEEIAAPDLRSFSQLLKPLIDSTSRQKKDWPLVELVEVYVKSDILKHGVKIVDLPGVMDSLESRAATAKSFMWRLDARIVAVSATRGADNKTALDLMLPSTEIVDMELDDKFGPESLAIALNKTDDIGIDNALDDWPDNPKVSESFHAVEALQEKINDMDAAIEDAKERLNLSDEDNIDGVTNNAKRRRNSNTEPQDKTDAEKELHHELNSLMNDRQTLEREQARLKSHLKHLCITARNERLTHLISETLHGEQEPNSSERSMPDLPVANVFPTSARAHAAIRKREVVEGFPDLQSTGIADLRDWVTRSTLLPREETAQTQLQRLHILIDAVDGWTQNQDMANGDAQLPSEHLAGLLDVLAIKSQALTTHILKDVRDKLNARLATIAPMRTTHIGAKQKADNGDDDGINQSVNYLTREMKSWPLRVKGGGSGIDNRMHYLTYKACVRRHGGIWRSKSKPPANYHWMGTVYTSFWRACKGRWSEAFNKWVIRHRDMAVSTARQVFSKFLRDLLAEPQLPNVFKEILKRNMYLLNNVLEAFVDGIMTKVREFTKSARDYRLETQKILDHALSAGFDDAKTVTGKGAYKNMEAKLKAYITSATQWHMFKRARDAIEKKLYSLKLKCLNSIKTLWNTSASKRLDQHLGRLAESSCVAPSGTRKSRSGTAVPTMTEEATKEKVQVHVRQWREYWAVVGPQLPQPTIGMTFDEADAQKKRETKDANKTKDVKGKGKGKGKGKVKAKGTDKPAKKSEIKVKKEAEVKVEEEAEVKVEEDEDHESDTEDEDAAREEKNASAFFG